MSDFVHLHLHTEYSKLDGLGKPQQWADRAADMGFTHLAMTDHGNCDGAIKFRQACKNAGIKSIFGAELYIVENAKEHVKGEKRGHITLLVKNDLGWMNLLSLISKSNVEGFYYRPRIEPAWLLERCDGLIIMTACASSFLHFPWGQELFRDLLHFKKDDLYVELMPHQFKEQYETNKLGLEIADKYGVKIVGTNDAHYIRKSDEISQEVLLAIQTNKKWNDPHRWKFQGSGYYLKSRTEMARAFRDQGILTNKEYNEAIYNTMEVAEKCNFEIQKLPVSLPRVPRLKDTDDVEALKRICEDGLYNLVEKKGLDEKAYRKRYEEELKIILDKGYERYFLIVWDIVSWCRQNDILVGPGRGSSAGSLICYLMGITRVDPLEFGLVFARFIAPNRCFTEDTLILCNNEVKEISDIVPGDIIINKFGNRDVVEKIKCFEIQENLLEIEYEGKTIRCTEDHEWIVLNKYDKVEKKKAKDLDIENDRLIRVIQK